MDADFSVELGAPSEEATLELPWSSGTAGGPEYLDLKRRPELLALVEEAARHPELRDFLRTVNAPASLVESAKCDVYSTRDLGEAETIYGACKLGGYVDLVFAEDHNESRYSFFDHEELAQTLVALLKKAPDVNATVEAIVRRCYYHAVRPLKSEEVLSGAPASESGAPRPGFYFTLYVFGYGDDEEQARQRWHVALQLVGNALRQISARRTN